MAWLYQDPLSENFKVCFRFRGRSYKKSLKTTARRDAEIILRLTGATMNDALIEWTDRSVAELVASSVDFAMRALGQTDQDRQSSE